MKVLSVGNSFSQDAHRYLHALAELGDEDIYCVNLNIGGCTLETHAANLKSDEPRYIREVNGQSGSEKVHLRQALAAESWDAVTVQQSSGVSGLFETYEPYLSELCDVIRAGAPGARLYFHRTWAYETGSSHPGFAAYGRDRERMNAAIAAAAGLAESHVGALPIPVGDTIARIRAELPEFDPARGGLPLTRDGFHLSFDYGRYTAAAVWLQTLTGRDIREFDRDPVSDVEPFDSILTRKIRECVFREAEEYANRK